MVEYGVGQPVTTMHPACLFLIDLFAFCCWLALHCSFCAQHVEFNYVTGIGSCSVGCCRYGGHDHYD